MLIAFLFLFLAVSVIALVFALNTLVALLRDRVPYVPTRDWAIDWMVEHLDLADGAIVYDIGCGDARVLKALKKKHPGINAIGYEQAWWPVLLAKWRTRGTGVIIRHQSFYAADFHDATLVFCFLLNTLMPKVEAFLRPQLRSGATVCSYAFLMPNWPAAEVITNPDRPNGSKLYIYKA